MALTTSPFAITLVPGPDKCNARGLSISACIDINREALPDAASFASWYEDILSLHRVKAPLVDTALRELVKEMTTQSVFQVGAQPLQGTPCSDLPDDDAISLWLGVMNANPQSVTPAAPPVTMLAKHAPAIVGAKKEAETATIAGAAAHAMMTTGSLSALRTLTRTERSGIVKAADDFTTRNIDRLSRASVRLQGEDLAAFRRADDGSLGSVAEAIKGLLVLLTKQFTGTPKYVEDAFDVLNSTPQLRRLVGTVVDIAVAGAPIPPVGTLFSVHLVLPQRLERLFHVEPSTFVKRALGGTVERIFVAETAGAPVQSSALQLQSTRVLCYEPQSAASAVEDAARDIANRDPEMLEAPVNAWMFASALQVLTSRNDNFDTRRRPVANAFRTLRREAERLDFLRQTNNRLVNTPTRGLVVYHPKPDVLGGANEATNPGAIRGYVVYVRSKQSPRWMSLTRISENLRWKKRGFSLEEALQPVVAEGARFDLGIQVGCGVEVAENNAVYNLTDGFVLAWDGASLSAQSPLRTADRGSGAGAEDDIRAALEQLRASNSVNDLETIATQVLTRRYFRVDWYPYSTRRGPLPDGVDLQLEARRSWADRTTQNGVKFHFGKWMEYEFLAVAQYHSGVHPLDEDVLNSSEFPGSAEGKAILASVTPKTDFLRYDHIRDLVVSFADDIYADPARKTLRRENPGESETHLVVRSGEMLDNDRCTRLVLPPPIPTFQTYLWYHKDDLAQMGPLTSTVLGSHRQPRTMSEAQVDAWYRRYSCEARTEDEFYTNIERAKEKNRLFGAQITPETGCGNACERWCGGTAQPPVYPGELRYLPDPVVTGIEVRFFADKECATPAEGFATQYCYFRMGRYPDVRPWRLVLMKPSASEPTVRADETTQTLLVPLKRGHTVYARATPMYNADRAHFADSLVAEHQLDAALGAGLCHKAPRTGDRICLLHTNATTFTLVHASQRPLIAPVIESVRLRRLNPTLPLEGGRNPPEASMFEAVVRVRTEQLNIRYDAMDDETLPMGDLDLFALWDEYNDHSNVPSKSIAQKRDARSAEGGFVRVARIRRETLEHVPKAKVSREDNPYENYEATVTFRSDHAPFTYPGFTNIAFRVRNASTFYSFFHHDTTMSDKDVEIHSLWSNEVQLPPPRDKPRVAPNPVSGTSIEADFMANNVKPKKPIVRKIVGLVTRDDDPVAKTVEYRGNRVRIYFEVDGRQTTGPERIGILTRARGALAKGLLESSISTAGQDIVTDGPVRVQSANRPDSQLQSSAIVTSGPSLEREYTSRFAPDVLHAPFDGSATAMVHFAPWFDEMERLWYIDVEFSAPDLGSHEYHNLFVQLGLVTYQPFGANYDDPETGQQTSLDTDFRFSEVEQSQFFSVYPNRLVTNPLALFGNGDDFTISGAVSSVYFRRRSHQRELRTQFVLEIQRCDDDGIWRTRKSSLRNHSTSVSVIGRQHDVAPSAPAPRHLLLPDALHDGLTDEQAAAATFATSFRVDYDVDFLESKRSGRYRAVVREVDWFPSENPARWAQIAAKLDRRDISNIPELRTVLIMLLSPRS